MSLDGRYGVVTDAQPETVLYLPKALPQPALREQAEILAVVVRILATEDANYNSPSEVPSQLPDQQGIGSTNHGTEIPVQYARDLFVKRRLVEAVVVEVVQDVGRQSRVLIPRKIETPAAEILTARKHFVRINFETQRLKQS